jgi:hypothetical protein
MSPLVLSPPPLSLWLYLLPYMAPLAVPMPFPDEYAAADPFGIVLSCHDLSVAGALHIVVSVGALLSSDLCINAA